MSMNHRKWLLIASSAFFMLSGTALAANSSSQKMKVKTKSDPTVEIHGFINLTTFWQDQDFFFGNGQAAELPLGTGNSKSGFDARATRLWLIIHGPSTSGGWTTMARVEGDFFGGNHGTSPYSSSQEIPRMRQAYFGLTSPGGRTSVTIGQQWDLVFPITAVPKSYTHIAFPLGFGNGMVGWRFPGVVLHQKLNTPEKGGAQWRFDVGAFTGQWDGPGSNTNFDTAGNVGFRPQIEARISVGSGHFSAWGTGYYSNQNLENMPAGAPSQGTLSSYLVEVGANWHPGDWSLLGAVYTGKAIGQEFGSMAQFGDISDKGGYVQGGYSFTKHWAAYATYTTDRPNEGDVIQWMNYGSSGRLKSQQFALSLNYTDGPWGWGVEVLHALLTTTTTGVDRATHVGNQLSVSAIYHF